MRAEDIPDSAEQGDRGRRYFVTLEDGGPLDVTVVDREQQAQGFFYRVWRRLTLRSISTGRSIQSLRRALEQEALLAYAAIAAGANAPKLIATSELGPDAVMLVYEHTGGRSLDSLPDEEITDELMRNTWRQMQALQSRRIAHRRLVGEAILVDRAGRVILTDLRGGEIAASDIVLRMDIAQLLTTLGLRAGAERSVASAVAVIGPDKVADSLPLLQPLALSRSTRATLRQLARERAQREREAVIEASETAKRAKAGPEAEPGDSRKAARAEKKAEKEAIDDALDGAREEDLLSQIRHQVLLIRPQAHAEPVRLERVKVRTLFTVIAGSVAAYFLLSQLANIPYHQLITTTRWGWVALAVLFSAVSYVAAAMSLLGFVPEKVPFLRAVSAQVAGSFVKLVAPAAVGGVALNTRFLQRAGVRPGLAVASVGASQLFGLGSHILLLMIFGYVTGTEQTPSLTPSRTVIAGLLTAAVLALVVTAVPFLRKFVVTRVRSLFAGVVPRMLDVLQQPRKLVTGIGGMLLLTGTFVMCLDASIRAFGGGSTISYASIAVVFLTANAVGSAVPTPGGVGAVETALTGALIIAHVDPGTAAAAVLLFRLLTFWLPVLPGWLCFNYLTRRGRSRRPSGAGAGAGGPAVRAVVQAPCVRLRSSVRRISHWSPHAIAVPSTAITTPISTLPHGRPHSESGQPQRTPDRESQRDQADRQQPGALVLPERPHEAHPGPQDRERERQVQHGDDRDQPVRDGVGPGDVEDPREGADDREVPVGQRLDLDRGGCGDRNGRARRRVLLRNPRRALCGALCGALLRAHCGHFRFPLRLRFRHEKLPAPGASGGRAKSPHSGRTNVPAPRRARRSKCGPYGPPCVPCAPAPDRLSGRRSP